MQYIYVHVQEYSVNVAQLQYKSQVLDLVDSKILIMTLRIHNIVCNSPRHGHGHTKLTNCNEIGKLNACR